MADLDKLVKKCRRGQLKMRPTLPLGQPMLLGNCGFIENQAFRYLGRSDTMLGTPPGEPVSGESHKSVEIVSGKDVDVTVRAHGEPSEAFKILIDAEAAVEITFASDKSFFVAADNVQIYTMQDPVVLLAAMLRLFNVGAWEKHFCFVYQIGVAASYSAALSYESSAKLLLNAEAKLAPGHLPVGRLAAGVGFARQSGSLDRIIAEDKVTAFYNAYQVKARFFRRPTVKTAAALGPDAAAAEISAALKVPQNENPFKRV
jgi:hypothetical protein